MITVYVPFERCQTCQRFKAETNFSKSYANDTLIGCDISITCSNRDLCKMLYSEAKEDLEKEKDTH